MISKILVPTDGSEAAQKAAKYAVDLAKQTGAAVTLLSVVDIIHSVGQIISSEESPTHLMEPIEDYLRQAAEAYTGEIEALCGQNGIKSETIIKSGHPVEEIVEQAGNLKADLIVMGSHGQSAIKATFLGSIAYGVIHKETKIPVLLVKE
jgi:nucleotide-binding universal stress UspA family protein